MPADEKRIPVESPEMADVIAAGHRELADFAPDMLRKEVVALVFMPWLTRFTTGVARSVREDERRAILDALPPSATNAKAEFRRGYENALAQLRAVIARRREAAP